MATVRAYTRFNMLEQDIWSGVVSKYTSSTIEIRAGDALARYTGSFTYDDFGNVYGQLRGIQNFLDGSPRFAVSDFSVDAYDFADALCDEDLDDLYGMVLGRADQIYGSNRGDYLLGLGGADVLRGNDGDDRLVGGTGADRLYAGEGADRLTGGKGKDHLYGGTDRAGDTFIFTERADSLATDRDVIHNFTRTSDHIDLRSVDAWGGTDENERFAWSGQTAADYSVWWRANDRGVVLNGDVNGDARADFQILVLDRIALSADDILL